MARRSLQEGFTLAGLIVILTIISIVAAYTVPDQWSLIMRRERERQTIFIMKQFARGIMRWQAKHNTPPVSLQQLQEAREPLMLRNGGKWPNPLTGREEDWILVPAAAVTAGGQPVPFNVVTPGGSGRDSGGRGRTGPSPLDPNNNPAAGGQPATGGITGPTKLNPEASPADYVGPFIGVRPRATGKSYIALNGAETYEQWVYTVIDLQNEIAMRRTALEMPIIR